MLTIGLASIDPSRGLLRDCENFAEVSLAALLPELGGGDGDGDLVVASITSSHTRGAREVIICRQF